MTILEIRDYLQKFFDSVELVGEDGRQVSAPAKIESAKIGEVSFVANEKYVKFLASTQASLVIVHHSVPVDEFIPKTSFLKVKDPYSAFVFLLQKFVQPRVIASMGIASSASIGEGVTIGEGVSIGDYAVIGDRCTIGNNCIVGAHTVLLHDVVMGDDTTLFPSVTCYDGTRIGKRDAIVIPECS